ncbi:MAG: hypothetical protein J1D86_02595 [Alistipes sp.]|nr:hypothetical protein [Alistipes sp.]
MYGCSLPLMLAVCFLGGFFRLWVVLGCINIFDIIQTKIIYHFGWQYVHNAAIVLYALGMTAVVSYGMPASALWLPLVLCGFGHVGVFIVLTVYAQATANFAYYFQILMLLGFVRTGIGAPIGDALYEIALTGLMNLRPDLELAIRELYGYSVIFGVFVLMLIAASRFKKQIYSTLPRMQSIYRRL